jgi:hypothetical protein
VAWSKAFYEVPAATQNLHSSSINQTHFTKNKWIATINKWLLADGFGSGYIRV